MKIDGGCHCGAITFVGEIDPEKVGICHCTDCQTLSGSVYRTFGPAPEASFRILTGTPKVYVKTGESGTKRAQAFCADCGTPIYSTSVDDGPKVFNLRMGAVRQRAQLPPRVQIWFRSAQHWAIDLGSVPKVDKQ